MRRGLVAALVVLLLSGAARAERLIVSVSNHRVTVTPNYSGEELVLFGSVARVVRAATEAGDVLEEAREALTEELRGLLAAP